MNQQKRILLPLSNNTVQKKSEEIAATSVQTTFLCHQSIQTEVSKLRKLCNHLIQCLNKSDPAMLVILFEAETVS